jgi:4-hydroxy-L-threonine phosphate dehydrogenase PdxA
MVNDALKVILCTVHVSLQKAIESLNEKLVYQAIKTAETACFKLDIKKPRIAVAGLNPHAGENGLMGEEDSLLIKPAINRALREGIDVTGPWPPDTVFMKAREGHFDIVVAQYHDQGLIPIKYLGLDSGVNITMGLPFVRTSPDHGTAFDIAGKGIANPKSFISAVSYASKLGS